MRVVFERFHDWVSHALLLFGWTGLSQVKTGAH